ncbi:MAG: hypothetical protein K0Q79_2044 [Flavipsychrobacter sp.]|jgi:cell division protein FtsQ|nr:hypothetical protein [Flavipsychrobacter sp.]
MGEKKRKISIRKILQMLLTLVVTSCCIVAIISASKIESEKVLKSVAIHYNNCKKYHSVEEQEILDLAITNRNIDITRTPASRLDIHGMEKTIMNNPWIANAQMFIDNERILHMYVTQRIPVVRVFQQNGASYYMDTTMSIIPLSANYIYYSTVVTNVPEIKTDSISWAVRKDIISLVRTIHSDSFWSAQISHVIVDSPGMYELVPVLGDHKILFGNALNAREKFDNLFAFYKNVLNRIGWDKYQLLDVRFAGQVVASPSLPYSGPVDKAVNTINWVNSIIETEAKSDSAHVDKKPVLVAQAKKDAIKPIAKAPVKQPAQVPPAKKLPVTNAGKQIDKKPAQVTQVKKDAAKPPVKVVAKQPAQVTPANKTPVAAPAKPIDKKSAPASTDKKNAQTKPPVKSPVKPPPKQAAASKPVTGAATKPNVKKPPPKNVKATPKKTVNKNDKNANRH